MEETIRQALAAAVGESGSPGAVAYVGNLDAPIFFEALGHAQLEPVPAPAQTSTIYDLASLTKVVATTTALLLLRDQGAVEFERSVSDYVPIAAFRGITVRHLLTHTGGLVAGRPLYRTHSSVDAMLEEYGREGIQNAPGISWRYSDAGFMLLGRIVERAAGKPLDRFCAERIFTPLNMADTFFNPPARLRSRCAPTERCAWRERIVQGEVHDENCCAVGGVSGHAGLFSTAEDLARFCRAFLGGALVSEAVLDEVSALGQVPSYPWQGLGWLIDPWDTSTTGFLPSRRALGHTGWTGTSMWMDRDTGVFAILLANTCHPVRDVRDNKVLRNTFYSGVARALYPRRTNTHAGLDRLLRENFYTIRAARRVALLTNHAAVDQMGRHILDVPGLGASHTLHVLYSPEHGIRGTHEAGAEVASERGAVPVISLYGKRTRPTAAELSEIGYFLIDLQDIGSRYYTYMATMRECLSACAQAKKPVLILDRPNPLGGAVLEGPIAERTGSPVCCAPIPVRHGMTMGELAVFFLREEFSKQKLNLSVQLLDSWRRDALFDECAYPWVAPSPNIPTPLTALVYVGTCLFEGTNLNEGRGTETPFHVVGAPWLDAEAVIGRILPEEMPGCSLSACRYTPRAIPGKASSPRYRDEECRGIRIHVNKPRDVRAFALALALLRAIRKQHPRQFEWGAFFDVLAGGEKVRTWLERDMPAADILAQFASPLDAFAASRPRRYE
ncbi:MAG TPA: DUF1343 domain-containing protein [Candidatus Hydrogenedentes bacterium]|nr:DUF1343 domain-containing protein [Candidatus Hydrogenedentota bacterium]HQM31357.1 DUF1343 domain-containing protein [Candidatus Hydrogenedentota bacterium]